MTEIVERIEEARERNQLTKAALCRRAGIPPTTYSNYTKRGDSPGIEMLESIAAVLGVTVGYLRTGASASENLKSEMERITAEIAALPADEQEKVITMIQSILEMARRK